ncbi:Protein of uncharacterised function (DUF3052) [Corynebacterium kutscheri]|nr:Protein of uncharacterised function (DUF3052) [Corynebacterium kutscheri]
MNATHSFSVPDLARILGLSEGDTVQEIGWDEDCDSSLSEAVEDIIDAELFDEDSTEICTAVLL